MPHLLRLDGHLEWGLQWSVPALLPVALLALAVLALSAFNLRTVVRRKHRVILLLLRAAAVASLGTVLLQPTWVSTRSQHAGRKVAVVVDRSQSMAQGTAGQQRFDAAMLAATDLAKRQSVQWFAMSDQLQPVADAEALRKLGPRGETTDFLHTLQALAEQQPSRNLAAVVLVSDGLDNALLHARAGRDHSLDADTADVLEKLGIPLHAIHIADAEPVRDVAIAAVRAASFGFTRTEMPVSIDLEISGLTKNSGDLTVTLRDNGQLVATKPVATAGPARRTLDLTYLPQHVGSHLLQAEVAALPGEATESNNRAWAQVQVVRDRTRVLHLAGHPSWDTRFLRTHLRADPSVDLVSFYVMVGQGSGSFVSAEDTTLIPFPTREIFEESLSSFDLVIFQDFPFGPFQVEQYLRQLQQYVTGGGAFLVLGGRQSLSAGGYYGTEIAQWLPVRLQPLAGEDLGYVDSTAHLQLTPAGRSHPVVQLDADADSNGALWAARSWHGRNTGLQATENASVLVTDDHGQPLLAVGEVGQGRSGVLASDGLWAWAFPDQGSDLERQRIRGDYHKLLDQLTAWLLRDPDLDSLRLEAPTAPIAQGQPVHVRVQVVTSNGKPAVGVSVKADLLPLTEATKDAHATAIWSTASDDQGRIELNLIPKEVGALLVVVEAMVDGQACRASVPLVVAPNQAEWQQLQPDDGILRSLTQASGGKLWRDRGPTGPVPLMVRDLPDLAEQSHDDLWSRPEVFAWIILLLGAEWTFRRRWGLA